MNDNEVRLAAVALTEILLLRARYRQCILRTEQIPPAPDSDPGVWDEAAVLFDPVCYIEMYPDIRETGVEPAAHYLSYGWRENRSPNLFFSPAWYRTAHPDVNEAGAEPLRHFAVYGAPEGRQPNPYFSPDFYLRSFPDVADSGMAPFTHFTLYGAAEGRVPSPDLLRLSRALQGLLDARQVIAATMIADDTAAIRLVSYPAEAEQVDLPSRFLTLLEDFLPEIESFARALLSQVLATAPDGSRLPLVVAFDEIADRLPG